MTRFALLIAALFVGSTVCANAQTVVPARAGALAQAIQDAEPGDTLRLSPGQHDGGVVITKTLHIIGDEGASVVAAGVGTVIEVQAPDVVVEGLLVRGSGSSHETLDSGIKLTKTADRAIVRGNTLEGNLHGIDIHGARDALVAGNTVTGRTDHRMNARGNGIYVWNAPGAIVENNVVRLGRDGIFVNTSRNNVFRGNRFEGLRFAVHYMYADNSEVSGNISIGNHLGYAIMFTKRVRVIGNLSQDDRDHGIMLNYANQATISGNVVRGGGEKCLFMYNANKNVVTGNLFQGCPVGIHFTAGSDRNDIAGNAFVGNRTQVKYVGSKHHEWSLDGRGNYWSDHAAFDIDGDGIADQAYRPNDMIDHVLWTQPAAKMLIGSPAVQLIRWAQKAFPALLPGGVVDSAPLTAPQMPEAGGLATPS